MSKLTHQEPGVPKALGGTGPCPARRGSGVRPGVGNQGCPASPQQATKGHLLWGSLECSLEEVLSIHTEVGSHRATPGHPSF